MPWDTLNGPHITFAGVAETSRAPSSIPMIVVPDEVLKVTDGPVPVTVEHGLRAVRAWAWAERAWTGTGRATTSHPSKDELTFSLSRVTSTLLGVAERIGTERCEVTVRVPVPVKLAPVMPLVHDLPRSDEIQVPADFPGRRGRAVMNRNGVAASVVIVSRDHVRPGTARISNHLRTITEPAVGARSDDPGMFLLDPPPATGTSRGGSRLDTLSAILRAGTERGLRWFFRAEEQAMRVVFAHPDDEHQHVVGMTHGALERLGVRSGDKVVLSWLGSETEVTVLQDHTPGDTDTTTHAGQDRRPGRPHDPTKPNLAMGMSAHLAVRVPTALRHLMHMPAASIVTVRRSTRSILARNLNNLIIPVASLALAGAALNDPNWFVLTFGAVATALLGLSRLRMGNRRAASLGRQR
ncbi:hypothetical protein [Myceligenerans indicum]|uniref:Uncharacterized protein n=1 Tax=Myceligenerans indicum TaxID=2593663 RepID=A0ABS1LLB8_9MICO|nr:hypothetical protein [Myceligenerans indicum]MBL0887060.1 hypothetical protein [Myceligenerans indicum]